MTDATRLAASLVALAAAGAAGPHAFAQSGWIVWSQPTSTAAIVESAVATKPAIDVEVADDFELVGTLERIVATGFDCFQCAPIEVAGAFVRLYAWTPSGPGALEEEQFIAAGDPRLTWSVGGPGTLDITLPGPIPCAGKRFVSVQLAIEGAGSWWWWVANPGEPNGSTAMTRDRSAGADAPWTQLATPAGPLAADVSFLLWGTNGAPPSPGSDPCGAWSVADAPNPAGTDHAILRDVVVLAPDDAWAAGEYTLSVQGSLQTRTLVQHWDGASWTIVPSPSPSPCPSCTHATFDAVAAAAPDDLWFAGGKRVQGPGGFLGTHIFVARFDGAEWTVMDTPLTAGGSGANVRDIEIIAPDDIWFFGDFIDPGSGTTPALAMHWDGSGFTVVPTPYPSGGTPGWGLEAASALASDDIWAVGGGSDGDEVASGYIIHWDGANWTRVQGPTPGTFQRLYAVEAIAPDDVWAVGDSFTAGVGYAPLFLHWNGSQWSTVPSPDGGRSLVAFASDHVYSSGSGIVHWNGIEWRSVEQFASVIGPAALALDGSSLCDLHAVGRRLVAGDLLAFAARIAPVELGGFTTPGDLDGDGAVGPADLALLLGAWGSGPHPADLDGDGAVGAADLAILLGGWSA